MVLFDEIEKAHPDVFNTLLQILEEGRLTDSQGRTVDFRNTVLIMTSNLGTQDLRKANVGFTKIERGGQLRADEGEGQRRPEGPLPAGVPEPHRRRDRLPRAVARAEVTRIVDLMARRVRTQLEGQGLGLELTQEAKLLLAERGYDPTLGARPLRRALQRLVEDPLSESILNKQFRAGEIIVVDAEPDPDKPGEKRVAFRTVEGFNPPPMELAEAGPAE